MHEQQRQGTQPSSDFQCVFLTIPGTEKSAGKVTAGEVTDLAPEVWLQIRTLPHQRQCPQPPWGLPFGDAEFRDSGDDRTDNRGCVFSTPRNGRLCPGDKASEYTGLVRSPLSVTAKASPSLPRTSVTCGCWVSDCHHLCGWKWCGFFLRGHTWISAKVFPNWCLSTNSVYSN